MLLGPFNLTQNKTPLSASPLLAAPVTSRSSLASSSRATEACPGPAGDVGGTFFQGDGTMVDAVGLGGHRELIEFCMVLLFFKIIFLGFSR